MDKVLKKSYDLVLNDERFVKLTFFSLLPYSIIFVGYIIYQTYFFILSINSSIHLNDIKLYLEKYLTYGEDYFWYLIIFFILILFLYFIVPPIAEASLINYLSRKDKSLSKCLGKGCLKFFPMFELHGFLSVFSFLFFFIVVSRLYMVDMIDSFFILPLLILWLIFVLFFNFTVSYAKYLVVLESMDMFDAVKKSVKLAFINFNLTLKYFSIQLLLYIRFFFNIIILVGLPLLLLYIFLKYNLFNSEIIKYLIIFIMIILFFLTAYINAIIEAFFIAMWYNIFKNIEKE